MYPLKPYGAGTLIRDTITNMLPPDTSTGSVTPPVNTPPTPPVKVEPGKVTGSSLNIDTSKATTEDTTNPMTKNDVVDYYKKLSGALDTYNTNYQTYLDEFNKYSTPSQEELDATNSLKNINQNERQNTLNIENKTISTGAMMGEKSALAKQAAIDRLAASENLSAITGARTSKLDEIKARLGFEDTRLEKLLGITKEMSSIDKSKRDGARQTIADILDATQGATFDELNPEAQQTIIHELANSPLSLDMIKKAMDRNKLAVEEDRLKAQPASVQEYEYAKANGYTGTFSQYQNEDANRKIAIAKAGTNGLSPYQTTQSFLTISNKYQADQIVNNAVNGQTASMIADQIIANPNSATNQLSSLYLLVKNLDPNSAVREGEIALANQTQSYLQKFGNSLQKISEGRVISPAAALELAKATKSLVESWNVTANRRKEQYLSQAKTAGVGDQFSQYLGGFQSTFGETENPLIVTDPNGVAHTFPTLEQANAFKNAISGNTQ